MSDSNYPNPSGSYVSFVPYIFKHWSDFNFLKLWGKNSIRDFSISSYSSDLNYPKDYGKQLKFACLAWKILSDCKFPKDSGKLVSLEFSDIIKYWRNFKFPNDLGNWVIWIFWSMRNNFKWCKLPKDSGKFFSWEMSILKS